jgi:hypothetical protein
VSPEQVYIFRIPVFFGAVIPVFFLTKLMTHSLYHWIEVPPPTPFLKSAFPHQYTGYLAVLVAQGVLFPGVKRAVKYI